MLDLVILTQSLQEQSQAGNQQRQEVGVSVRILPTLHHSDLQVLEEQTNFYKVSGNKRKTENSSPGLIETVH